MNRYPSYKPTGVKWLGEIPSHWDCVKLKSLCKMYGRIGFRGYSREDLVDEGEGAITLSPSNFVEGHLDYSKCSYLSWKKYYESPEIMVQNGDIVFVKTASIGKVALVRDLPLKTTINPQILVFKNLNCNASYLNYYLQTSMLQGWILASANGSTIYTISQVEVGNYPIFLPPLDEQSAIAAYLDTATAKIDAAIAQQQKMIDLLNERKQIIINRAVTKGLNPNAKMKDSGVEWIGVIPEKWEVCALKHYCLLTNGDRGPNYPNGEDIKDSGVLFATADNIHGLRIEVKDGTKYITKEKYNTLRGAKMRKGDIVFCLRGAGFGNCAINDLFDEGTIASSLVNITPLNIDCEFMNYVLHSAYIRMQEIFSSNGSCADNVSAQDLGDYLIVVPPKDDQKKIVNAITSTILPIDRLIKNTNNQISLLQERKQIIINEVVTGKVKVTN